MPQPQPDLNNLHQLIAELGEKLDLTGEEIADVLWLALKRQEFVENFREEQLNFQPDFLKSLPINIVLPRNIQRLIDTWKNGISEDKKVDTTGSNDIDTTKIPLQTLKRSQKAPIYTSESFPQAQGLPIRIPDAPSLREPLNFAQSLYPLMRRVATGNKTILDEVATVELVASENISLPVNICFPVLKSEPEPWLDLALVIDESQSMLIWRHTVDELQRLLKNYGIFRDLQVWGIKPDQEGNALQIFSRMGSNHRLSDPKEIIDPTGRRLILVVSDCVSNLWRKGIIFPVLHDWTQKQPLAVIQLLPEWMWQRSALSLGTAVGFSSSTAGVANRDLLVNKKFLREERIKIPVLTLEPAPAAQWSQMLVGKADAAVPGYLLPTQLNIAKHPLLKRQQEALSSLDSQQRVDRFRLNTSPLGRKLAALLAAAPVISLPIVRLIQESLLPESRQVQVAEVFLGGLLKPKSEQIIEPETHPDVVEYEFLEPHIRDIFLEDAPVRDSGDVLNAVSRYVAEQMDKSLDEFMALLTTPGTAGQEQVKPFAEVTARILRKLGGDYLKLALQLEQSAILKTFPFETVTVNHRGEITKRESKTAQYFSENLGNNVILEMVAIPGGQFLMGSPAHEAKRSASESPQHQVAVPPFFMGKYPITQAQWRIVAALPQINCTLDPDPSRFKGDDRPVEKISWYESVEFCDRLSKHTKQHYRLPSEAEWEYAGRAGTTTPFHFGQTITSELANYNGNYAYGAAPKGEYRLQTTPVGSFNLANAFGLYDMHGNVWEWCADHWHRNYGGAPTDGSAWIDFIENDNQNKLMLRGGSWSSYPWACCSACRYGNDHPEYGSFDIGFRVVLSAART
ncbi:MAG: formylglycine-generating enzyme family protein [Rhizonema sp. PD38]|nr:formylglycine-generating enzyme family protein [Rhizonema sp. PD38]